MYAYSKAYVTKVKILKKLMSLGSYVEFLSQLSAWPIKPLKKCIEI